MAVDRLHVGRLDVGLRVPLLGLLLCDEDEDVRLLPDLLLLWLHGRLFVCTIRFMWYVGLLCLPPWHPFCLLAVFLSACSGLKTPIQIFAQNLVVKTLMFSRP